MDIHTILEIRDMKKALSNKKFSQWLDDAIISCEIITDEQYKRHLHQVKNDRRSK
jgi:hypothetical protein